MEEYVEAAEKYPEDIPNMMHWACVEGCVVDEETFVDALIKAGALDVNKYDMWECDASCKTTLLLSACEFRKFGMVKLVLSRGADVRIKNEQGYGVIDVILHGCARERPERCARLLNLVMPHNPPMDVLDCTRENWKSDYWRGYRECRELTDTLSCIFGNDDDDV